MSDLLPPMDGLMDGLVNVAPPSLQHPDVADAEGTVRMVDVVREIQAIALAAERAADPEIVAACRRAQSLLARLRNDFIEDLIGAKAPSERAA